MRNRDQARASVTVPWALLAVIAAFVFVAFVRLRVADVPLERDEGEYAFAGRLILQGIPPYSIAYNMKFPGVYYAYALILSLLGHTARGIHLGLLLVNGASIVLVFALGRRLMGEFAGAVAAVCFAVLSVDRWMAGPFAHATHFVVLAALAGLLVLLRANESKRMSTYAWSGVLLGISVLMKQHAIFFLPFGAALILASDRADEERSVRRTARRIGLLAAGAALPLVAIVLLLSAQGVLGRFWFWTFRYAGSYVTQVPLGYALPNFVRGFSSVIHADWLFWCVAGIGLAALWVARWETRTKIFVTGFLIASFLAVVPGFYFRRHYFILALPPVALLCGVAIGSLRQLLARFLRPGGAALLAVIALAVPIGVYAAKESFYLFSMTTRELSREMYAANPFIEAVEIAKYIKERTNADDRIAVIGSEPEIYFYADRKAATGYIYTYALMEPQPYAKSMQQEMIREIEAAHPKYLVFSWVSTSWLLRDDSDQGIIDWAKRYVRQCYDPVGVADIFSPEETRMVWDEAARDYAGTSPNLVYTLRRKSDAPCVVGE